MSGLHLGGIIAINSWQGSCPEQHPAVTGHETDAGQSGASGLTVEDHEQADLKDMLTTYE